MGGPDLSYIEDLGGGVIDVINGTLIPVLFALAFIVFLFGVAKAYIISGASDTERAKGHKLILWGLIGFVVMLSVWGIINIFVGTFDLADPGPGGPLPAGPDTLL